MEQEVLGRSGQESYSRGRIASSREARSGHVINFLPGVHPGSLCL